MIILNNFFKKANLENFRNKVPKSFFIIGKKIFVKEDNEFLLKNKYRSYGDIDNDVIYIRKIDEFISKEEQIISFYYQLIFFYSDVMKIEVSEKFCLLFSEVFYQFLKTLRISKNRIFFELIGRTIDVKIKNIYPEGYKGLEVFHSNRIELAFEGFQSEEDRIITFLHEVLHYILDIIDEKEYNNETFINILSNLLYQYFITAKF